MATQAEIQKRNLESSVLFMQQEHAKTLKGLHEEIQKLQKKCSEVTFQLAMQSTSTTDEEVYKKRAEQLELSLATKEKQCDEYEDSIDKKGKKIILVEQQLKAQEKKYQSEHKLKDQLIRDLNKQLDTKSEHIATLTNELLLLKKQYLATLDATQQVTPVPPSEPQKSGTRRRPRVIEPPSNDRRAPSARRLPTKSTSIEDVPDPAPFLQTSDQIADIDVKANHVPLPPIQKKLTEGLVPLSKSFNRLHLRQQDNGPNDTTEGTLAVDQVSDQTSSWRQAQESKSTDCT